MILWEEQKKLEQQEDLEVATERKTDRKWQILKKFRGRDMYAQDAAFLMLKGKQAEYGSAENVATNSPDFLIIQVQNPLKGVIKCTNA